MLKRKPKTLTPAQVEEIRAKDFFDMILPGTIKFFSDHYIVGDSYRCVWAIREYPPSTEEQAILLKIPYITYLEGDVGAAPNESRVWRILYAEIGNPYGVAGLMGNLFAESGLQSNNLQPSRSLAWGL